MTRPTCQSCEWWASHSPKLAPGFGFCQLNPPVPVVVDNEIRTVWPITGSRTRCALYQPSATDPVARDSEIAWRLHEKLQAAEGPER